MQGPCKAESSYTTWTPCDDVLGNLFCKNYVLVVLNCPINIPLKPKEIITMWLNAKLRVTVDGGTKRWLNWMQDQKCQDHPDFAPDLITGDLDSLPLNVMEYFTERKSKLIRTPDQNETDFTKALREVKSHCETEGIKVDNVLVLGDTSGRLDHIIANINTMFKAHHFFPSVKIYQIASNSITFLLEPGRHRINISNALRQSQEWCALIPFGAPCTVSTTGLKWNLSNSKMQFGAMVSTSNTYNGDPFVTIVNDNYLVWSMGIQAVIE